MKIHILSKNFGNKVIFEDFSLTINPGEHVLLSAPSGRGKTTLLRMLSGLDRDFAGELEVPERVSFAFQDDRLIEPISVLSNLHMVSSDEEKIQSLLSACGLEKEGHALVSTLSGGMKKRLSIIRALLVPFDALFLDEPFNGLDEERKKEMASLILRECGSRTMIAVCHSREDEILLKAERIITF